MNVAQLKEGRVAVLMGGTSAEREVSLQSGTTVLEGLTAAGFDAHCVDPADANWMQALREADFAFIALHGPGGEDGSMQGLLELFGIPYSGSGILGSALAMDKVRTKRVWQAADLPTADFEILSAQTQWDAVIDRLGTVFVKPACEGSSIGMSRAEDAEALSSAYDTASAYSGPVLAEQLIRGPEYSVTVLGGQPLPSIRMQTDNEFYDYEAKYLSQDTQYHCPSGLTAQEEEQLAALCLEAFEAAACGVWGRVDVMRDEARGFQLLEVNTVPGMTTHSLVPMSAMAAGIEVPELVERIVMHSLEVRA